MIQAAANLSANRDCLVLWENNKQTPERSREDLSHVVVVSGSLVHTGVDNKMSKDDAIRSSRK